MEKLGVRIYIRNYLVDLRDHGVQHLALEGAEHDARVLHIKLGKPRALPYLALQVANDMASVLMSEMVSAAAAWWTVLQAREQGAGCMPAACKIPCYHAQCACLADIDDAGHRHHEAILPATRALHLQACSMLHLSQRPATVLGGVSSGDGEPIAVSSSLIKRQSCSCGCFVHDCRHPA